MVETGRRGAKSVFWVMNAVELRYGAMVKEVFTYVRCFNEERDIMLLEFVSRTNAGEHEQLWGSECPATDDNFSVGFEDLA